MRLVKSLNCMFSQFVKLSKYEAPFDQVAKLELDNPKKKNALSVDLLAQVLLPPSSSTPLSRKSTSSRRLGPAYSRAVPRDTSALEPILKRDSTKLTINYNTL